MFTEFLKYKRNRKIWKVSSSGKVDWHNLLEQFPHISTANFAILFSLENLKEKTAIFRNCNFFGQSYFLHSGNQVFAYHAYMIYLYIKKACLHTLCMNRPLLDRESLDCVSWTSTTQSVMQSRMMLKTTLISAPCLAESIQLKTQLQ